MQPQKMHSSRVKGVSRVWNPQNGHTSMLFSYTQSAVQRMDMAKSVRTIIQKATKPYHLLYLESTLCLDFEIQVHEITLRKKTRRIISAGSSFCCAVLAIRRQAIISSRRLALMQMTRRLSPLMYFTTDVLPLPSTSHTPAVLRYCRVLLGEKPPFFTAWSNCEPSR